MSSVAAIGEGHLVAGFGLAGVAVSASDDPSQWIEAWEGLDEGVGLLLLTEASRDELGGRLAERKDLLWEVVG